MLCKRVRFTSVFLSSIFATGCMATFATRTPEGRVRFQGRPSLYVTVTSETVQLDNTGHRIPFFHRDYTNDVINALRACGCYHSVSTTPESGFDLEASVHVRRVVENDSALLNLATADLIPAVEERYIGVRVRVRDPESHNEAEAERSRTFRVWYELLFLPIYPFKSPARFEMKLFPQLVRESVAEAAARVRMSAVPALGSGGPS